MDSDGFMEISYFMSLWLLTKVISPLVGATKLHHMEGAAKAVEPELTEDELKYLEEPYVPHPPAGVMAQNEGSDASKNHAGYC